MSACHLSDRCQCVLRGVVASPAVRHHRHAAWRSPGPEDTAGLLRGHRRKAEHHHEDVQGRGEQRGGRGAPRPQHHQQKHRREIHHLIPDLQHGERRTCASRSDPRRRESRGLERCHGWSSAASTHVLHGGGSEQSSSLTWWCAEDGWEEGGEVASNQGMEAQLRQ